MSPLPLFGLLNVNKPTGVTSRRVVDRVARIVRPFKVGHAGTLDPLASGVLVVCVGPATRLITLLLQQTKEYRARFVLGKRSDTDDVTGQVSDVSGAPAVAREQVQQYLQRFVGRIEQVPPQFSAVRVGGRRAYKLARQGREFEIQPKTVQVHHIDLVQFAYPEMELLIECGSGTYIRSIGRDVGELLGCGAVMSELVRTRVGRCRLDEAIELDELDRKTVVEVLLPPTIAVAHLPKTICRDKQLDDIRCGRPIHAPGNPSLQDGETIAVLTPDGTLACVAHYRRDDEALWPKQVFLLQD